MLKSKRNLKLVKNFVNFNAAKGINSSFNEKTKIIQKIRNTSAVRNILNRRLANRNQKKEIIKNLQRLPFIALNKRRVCSPTKMSDFKKRMVSPITSRKLKIMPDKIEFSKILCISNNPFKGLTIDCTEEQAIINDKARVRVMEAKMSRFTGFKSPRVFLTKLIDNRNNFKKYESKRTQSSDKLDVVHTNERCEKSQSFKIQKKDMLLLL